MRKDRFAARTLKLLVIFGSMGLLFEGMFEWKLLLGPFLNSPSVPGQSKIIEHFFLQHGLFVAIGLLLILRPSALIAMFQSMIVRIYLAVMCVAVTLPEIIVSRMDLFRPYPFNLHSSFLARIQMLDLGSFQLNFLQLQHLMLSHFALMGTILIICLNPQWLIFFAGPHTGETVFRLKPSFQQIAYGVD